MNQKMNKEKLNEIVRLHGLWLIGQGGVQADLRGANLEGVNLRGANLRGASLIGANLRGAYLLGASLEDVDLRGASLLNAILQGVNLQGANLQDVDLRWALLKEANLQDADLRNANLRNANLQEARLRDTLLDCANGVEHYSVGWHGHGEQGQTLRAVRVNGELVFYCGCFQGNEADLRKYIEEGNEEYAESRLRALQTILALCEFDENNVLNSACNTGTA